ncbi:MAG TPA: hypothetical protein VGO30_08785, partial [Mycobacterium sp.]|nr:hypothetical protein [Mycobacterium sp.]
FAGWLNRIKHLICAKKVLLENDKSDPEAIARDAAVIADVLLSFADQLPLATISVLIVKVTGQVP